MLLMQLMVKQRTSSLNSGDKAAGVAERLGRWLFDQSSGAMVCAMLFLGVGLWVSVGRIYLHDEGLFTYVHARAMRHEFWAIFFLHKAKPVNMLLEVLPSQLGFGVYLFVHTTIGAAAVFLVSAAARALGIRHPNMAGWFLATSAIFLIASANGYPNLLGAAMLALFLFLYYSGHRIPSALVLGLLPLCRYELGLVVLAYLIIRVFRHKDFAFVAWAMLLPGAYVLAGVVYTGDLLWFPHAMFDPYTMPQEFLGDTGRDGGLWKFLSRQGREFAANSPFLLVFAPAIFLGRLRHAKEPGLVAFAVVVVQCVVQASEFQGFTPQLRHTLAPLPLVALAVALGLEQAGTVFKKMLKRAFENRKKGPRRLPSGHIARFALVLAATGFLGEEITVGMSEERKQHEQIHALMSELTRLGVYTGQKVYSDIFTAGEDRCAGFRDTGFLVNQQINWELERLTQSSPKQRQAVFRAFEEEGWVFDPARLPLEKDALYIISVEERNIEWKRRLDTEGVVVARVDQFAAYQLKPVPDPDIPAPPRIPH